MKNYYVKIENYKRFDKPVDYASIRDKLSKPFSQAGIIQIKREDFNLIVNETREKITAHVLAPSYSLEDFVNETSFEEGEIKSWKQLLQRKKQLIFQGPPGTGKTFVALRLARLLISGTSGFMQVVQFHPDYSYEDFIKAIFQNLKTVFFNSS